MKATKSKRKNAGTHTPTIIQQCYEIKTKSKVWNIQYYVKHNDTKITKSHEAQLKSQHNGNGENQSEIECYLSYSLLLCWMSYRIEIDLCGMNQLGRVVGCFLWEANKDHEDVDRCVNRVHDEVLL